MSIIETIISFGKEYFVLIILGIVVLIFILVKNKKPKEEKEDKMFKKKNKKKEEVTEEYKELKVPVPPRDFSAKTLFVKDELNEGDMIKDIEKISEDFETRSEEFEKEMKTDYKGLTMKLKEVEKKLNIIKSYGLKLGNLYDKYEERRKQLGLMTQEMEKIIE